MVCTLQAPPPHTTDTHTEQGREGGKEREREREGGRGREGGREGDGGR